MQSFDVLPSPAACKPMGGCFFARNTFPRAYLHLSKLFHSRRDRPEMKITML
jgi:hypothetical protein